MLSTEHVTSLACSFQVLKKVTGGDTRASQFVKFRACQLSLLMQPGVYGTPIRSTVIAAVLGSMREEGGQTEREGGREGERDRQTEMQVSKVTVRSPHQSKGFVPR